MTRWRWTQVIESLSVIWRRLIGNPLSTRRSCPWLEHGQRPLDRRSHISALASALHVSESDLVGGPHLSADAQQADPHATIPGLRVALQTNTLASPALDPDRARPLAELARTATDLERLRRVRDYTERGPRLAGLLDELHVHAAVPADPNAHRLALQTLVEACVAATFTAKNLGYPDPGAPGLDAGAGGGWCPGRSGGPRQGGVPAGAFHAVGRLR